MLVPRVLLFGAMVASPALLAAATFTVNATPDLQDTNPGDGVCATASFNCTLHAALQEADATAALDTIAFAIPGAGAHTIPRPTNSPLMHPVVIDGFTQPGAQPNTNPTGGLNAVLKIEITGGLVLPAGSVLRGLVLNVGGNTFGPAPGAPALTVVEGCYVGTDPTGMLARGANPGLEFVLTGGPVRVGGTLPAQRNLISGNYYAVRFICALGGGSCNPGSVVQGNLIGTTAAGDAPLPNFAGITVLTSGGLTIGGAYNGPEQNVIAANTYAGILIAGNPVSGTVVVQGNRIGRDAGGSVVIPNGFGIRIQPHCAGPPCNSALDGPPVQIGGSPANRNVVQDNLEHGILATTGILDISDNLINGNGGSGVFLETSTPWRLSGQIARNTINGNAGHGISGNTILGAASITIQENFLANSGDGISLAGSFRARLAGNAIPGNGGLGIDLGGDGVTPNDFLDQDTGANDLMNFPVLTGACTTGGNVVVSGSLHSRPNFNATVEFFESPFCDASGNGEGATTIGTAAVTTDNGGDVAFVSTAGAASPGQFITATATSAAGETSEFSACVPVTPVPFPPPQVVSGPSTVCIGEPFRLNGVTGAGQYQWSRNGTPIPGATLLFYERTAAAPGDAGDYVVSATNGCGVTATSAPHTLAVVSCTASAVRIDVDRHAGAGTVSDLNGVLEPAESVLLEPRYLNNGAAALALTGTATLTGPTPGAYALPDAAADYGTTPPGQLTDCFNATGNCYRAVVDAPSGRPSRHWDAVFAEDPSGAEPVRQWPMHVGDTFADVPRGTAIYRFVETIVHRNITAGCSATDYCPSASTLREQMAVFVLIGKEGTSYRPPDCNPVAPRFADLPASSPFCRWVEELARRQVVAGCGGSNYCPGTTVSREQMAVFVLATREAPGYTPPACVAGAEQFADVPAASPFCRWVEELHRRGVVAGCGNGNFCPGSPITRGEMSVFLTVTFGLQLYGP